MTGSTSFALREPERCCPSEDVFVALVRGDLSSRRRTGVERHVAICSWCRRLLSELVKIESAAIAGPVSHRCALSPGTMVTSRYRVCSFIAKGGSGEVYRVRDLVLEQDIALKLLICGQGISISAVERAMRHELMIARRLTHPNVCRLFDLGRVTLAGAPSRVCPFLSMELLDGVSLRARLRIAGRLSLAEAWPIAAQVAQALDAIHAVGVVHRDLKGGNIVLTKPRGYGRVRAVVSDFGLALLSRSRGDTQTGSGLMVGTATHVAPEQLEAKPVGPAADVFAYGVVLYEMVTGRLPYAGASPLLTALLRLREPPPNPSLYAPNLPSSWQRTIMRCLDRDPERRFATAGDALASLGGDPAAAAPRNGWWAGGKKSL